MSVLVLAHGSGKPCDSPWMNQLTEALESHDIKVVRFNFGYMVKAQEAGKPRPPSKMPVLVDEFRQQLKSLDDSRIFVGGKSLGSRVASHLACEEDCPALGWIAFGYPFHPPGKLDKLRTEHLRDVRCPGLICQGERDTFGKRPEVEGYDLPDSLELLWLQDGDHQFKPPKRSEATLEDNIAEAAEAVAQFMS